MVKRKKGIEKGSLGLPSLIFKSDSLHVHAQSCLTLCSPINCSPPGFSLHGIFQARILEVQISFCMSGDLPDPGIELVSTVSPALAGGFFTIVPPGKPETHCYAFNLNFTLIELIQLLF